MKKMTWQVLSGKVHDQVLLNHLQRVMAGKHVALALTIVDGRDLLVVKEDQMKWGVPQGALCLRRKEYFEDAMSRILPCEIIVPRQNGVKEVNFLAVANAEDGGQHAVLLSAVCVDRSCILHNSCMDHTWARSVDGLKKILSDGEPDESRNEAVLFGVEEAMKRGLLNWGQGAVAH